MDGSIPPAERLYLADEVRGWPVVSALRAGMHLRARCLNPHCQSVAVVDAGSFVKAAEGGSFVPPPEPDPKKE